MTKTYINPDNSTGIELSLENLTMTVISPTQLTANQDNWNPTGLSTAGVIRASTDASRNLTGIVAPSAGKLLVLENVGAQDLVLKHDVTSTAANRFYCPNDTDLTLKKDAAVVLQYDTTSSRWRVVATSGAAGATLTVTTPSGSPNVASVDTIKFPDGSLVDLGSGAVSVQRIPEPRQAAVPNAVGGGTTVTCTFPQTPLSTSVFFILSSMVVATVQAISSISQTNVTWSLIHAANNGTNDKVEVWVGVGNGSTPGTTATITYAGTITAVAAVALEWPTGYLGSTPVIDQSADATGTGVNQATGNIVPTTANNLTFVVCGNANGGIEMRLRSPFNFTEMSCLGGFFAVFGYLWGSVSSLVATVPSQTSAAWANTIVSVK